MWALVGTFWLADVNAEDSCFVSEQGFWHFISWLIFFYVWVIGYNTSLLRAAFVHTHNGNYYRLEDAGMAPAAINELWSEQGRSDVICTVCQYEFLGQDRARILPCGHRFHLSCVDIWLAHKGTCPNCKRDLRAQDLTDPLLR